MLRQYNENNTCWYVKLLDCNTLIYIFSYTSNYSVNIEVNKNINTKFYQVNNIH